MAHRLRMYPLYTLQPIRRYIFPITINDKCNPDTSDILHTFGIDIYPNTTDDHMLVDHIPPSGLVDNILSIINVAWQSLLYQWNSHINHDNNDTYPYCSTDIRLYHG